MVMSRAIMGPGVVWYCGYFSANRSRARACSSPSASTLPSQSTRSGTDASLDANPKVNAAPLCETPFAANPFWNQAKSVLTDPNGTASTWGFRITHQPHGGGAGAERGA